MPSFPSSAAILAARERHHGALAAADPVTIVLNGKRIAGSGLRSELRRPLDPGGGGDRLVETFTGHILKSSLRRGVELVPNKTVITIDGDTFIIREVGGLNTHDIAWHIVATRSVKP